MVAASLALCSAVFAPQLQAADDDHGGACVPVAKWVFPGRDEPVTLAEVMQGLDGRRVILIGEHHDNPEHHRWQLHTLAALHARYPDMVIGFEMFPHRVQPVLDRWVGGELSEEEFLEQTRWQDIWSFDADMYMPLFDFARMYRIPMRAINFERELIFKMREQGTAALPADMRDLVSEPAAPGKAYLNLLAMSYAQHGMAGEDDGADIDAQQLYRENKRFQGFVKGQLWWDRTMAEALARPLQGDDPPLVVGIVGSGHVINHFGIPHQLADLGVEDAAVLVPWDERYDCSSLSADFAEVVFGMRSPDSQDDAHKPLLGVFLESGNKGPRIAKVVEDSVAQAAGIRSGDIIVEAAGAAVAEVGEVIERIQAMQPGTWLPLVVLRDDKRIDLVAKFPPQQE